ncbi:MAG: CHAT domain-containing protein, partial [Armatimonadota bacterium]|nr:CHAT domain-containing protein [Armatimonadota bacterium]
WLPTPAQPGIHTTLTIVPFGPLFQIPFAALIDADSKYLIQRYAIRTTPSLTVLRYTRERAAALKDAPTVAAIFGDPTMPAGIPDLPGAKEEALSVASIFKSGTPETGPAATEAEFRREAPLATEIHLATHGYVNEAQPLLSGVILGASEGTDPAYTRDGFLTVAEVFRLHLNARLVTLSACDTGLGATTADGVFGLQSAFLSAGSASLLSTLWKVNDTATSRLMQTFYRGVQADPKHDRAEALRQAQLVLIETKQMAAPVYWGAFLLTGEAR